MVSHSYRRIVWVSTGARGYDTPSGTGYLWRKWAGWHQRSLYSGAWMYDSIYFRRDRPGIALHGSSTNDLVKSDRVSPHGRSHGTRSCRCGGLSARVTAG